MDIKIRPSTGSITYTWPNTNQAQTKTPLQGKHQMNTHVSYVFLDGRMLALLDC